MLKLVQTDQALSANASDGYSEEETEAMQRAVLALFRHWGVTDEKATVLLGGISVNTLRRWRTGHYGRVARDLADRMSNLLGINKALRINFVAPETGYAWIAKPNDAFAGKSALDVMLAGGMSGIIRVRRYLDSVRNGW